MKTQKDGLYDFETIKIDGRRSKAKQLWQGPGWLMQQYRRTKKGKVTQLKESLEVYSSAYTLPKNLEFVETIVIDGIKVYDALTSSKPATAPLVGGGRYRFVRSYFDGVLVQRTFYLYDLPREAGEKLDIRVIFGFSKKKEIKDEQQ